MYKMIHYSFLALWNMFRRIFFVKCPFLLCHLHLRIAAFILPVLIFPPPHGSLKWHYWTYRSLNCLCRNWMTKHITSILAHPIRIIGFLPSTLWHAGLCAAMCVEEQGSSVFQGSYCKLAVHQLFVRLAFWLSSLSSFSLVDENQDCQFPQKQLILGLSYVKKRNINQSKKTKQQWFNVISLLACTMIPSILIIGISTSWYLMCHCFKFPG